MNSNHREFHPAPFPFRVCVRCRHSWFPRQAVTRICPKCKSALWSTARGTEKAFDQVEAAIILEHTKRLDSGCWLWVSPRSKRVLHARPSWPHGKFARVVARNAYHAFKGPIPKGLVLDHLCKEIGCINPDHLDPVTARENNLREGPRYRERLAALGLRVMKKVTPWRANSVRQQKEEAAKKRQDK